MSDPTIGLILMGFGVVSLWTWLLCDIAGPSKEEEDEADRKAVTNTSGSLGIILLLLGIVLLLFSKC